MENPTVQTPEQEELQKKLTELEELKSVLVQKELELINLRSEINAFQNQYLRTIGVRLVEIDELDAKIAEKLAKKYPGDVKVTEEAETARVKANETRRTASYTEDDKKQPLKFLPSNELKKLYYDVAKQIHPDLSKNEFDKEKREELMKRANEAFRNNDEKTLSDILSEWVVSPENIEGEGIGIELVRLIRQIKDVKKRVLNIENELNIIITFDLYKLMVKADDSKITGYDLIEKMSSELDKQILEKRKYLFSLG
jgi:hypothetical protein